MPKKKPPPKNEKPQKERFLEAAKAVGASNRIEDFDAAFDRVVKRASKRAQASDKR